MTDPTQEQATWAPDKQGRPTRWVGGLIRYGATGRAKFIIERMVNGRRYLVSTRRNSLREALKQLARFENDPGQFERAEEEDQPVFLTEALADEFVAWSRDVKQNSKNWVSTQKIYLAAWRERLYGRDLRRLSLRDDVDGALKHWGKGRPHRIKVLKAFMGWLRHEKRLLTSAQDATLDLPVPQARPEQSWRVKAVPRGNFEKVLKHLVGPVRDGLLILGATGCHYSELERFIRDGAIEPVPEGADDGVAVLMVQHKSGVPHRVRIGPVALEAAKRLKDRAREALAKGAKEGKVRGVTWDAHTFNAQIKAACDAAEVPRFTAGQLRASVATWAVNAGAEPGAVSAFLGHRSTATTRRFYSTHAAPKSVPTLVK